MGKRICILTGATSGIGEATAEALVKKGFDLVLPCRDLDKGADLKKRLLQLNADAKIDLYLCDISSQSSIRNFVFEVKKSYESIDVLINNAGVLNNRFSKTVDGIENTFAVNVLSQWMLSTLLLDLLKNAEQGRIINLTSDSYVAGKIDFGNLNGEKTFGAISSYANSALGRILNTFYLAGLLSKTNVTVNCFHPGATDSNIGNNNKGVGIKILNVLKIVFKKPSKAAEGLVYLATSKEISTTNGEYFVGLKIKKTNKLSRDMALAKQFWEKCE